MEFTNEEKALSVLEIGRLIQQYKNLPIYEHYRTIESTLIDELAAEVDNENTSSDISSVSRAVGRLYTLRHKCVRHIAALEKIRTALTNEYFEENHYAALQKETTEQSIATCKKFVEAVKFIHISNLITSENEPLNMRDYSIPEEAQN